MVKNEEKNIKRLFSSMKSWIDGIVLCDTGSTDNTIQLAKTLIEDIKLPGRIYQYPWENFGKSRTKLCIWGIFFLTQRRNDATLRAESNIFLE